MSLTAVEQAQARNLIARARLAVPRPEPTQPEPTIADVQAAKIKALELEIDVLSRDLRDALKQPPKETGMAQAKREIRELNRQLEAAHHMNRVSIQRNQILANKLAQQAA